MTTSLADQNDSAVRIRLSAEGLNKKQKKQTPNSIISGSVMCSFLLQDASVRAECAVEDVSNVPNLKTSFGASSFQGN